MPSRAVAKLVSVVQKREGGGFVVRRAIGHGNIPHVDPFIMLDHFGPVKYGPGEAIGAPDHPHRGFETVTYILQGGIEHKDSAGNTGVLSPGWVQWMTAGHGVIHSEMPTADILKNGGTVEGFQLWVNLPKALKMVKPRYQDTPPEKIPVVKTPDGKTTIKVIAGAVLGKSSPIQTRTKMSLLDIAIEKGSTYNHPLPKSDQGFVYCWRGEGTVGSASVAIAMGQIAILSESDHGDSFTMKASESQDCHLLFAYGEPIREPIVQHGPFVMNTQEEIEQAFDDYRNGVLGSIDGSEERYQQTEAAKARQQSNGTW